MPIYSSVTLVWGGAPAIQSISNITTTVLETMYLAAVDAEINGKVGKRYALPFADPQPPLLIQLATREAIYRIMVQRALIQFPPAQQGRHPLQQQHIDDQKLLEQIANGEVQLITNSGAVIEPDLTQLEIWSTTMDYNPTMHEGEITDMVQDESKLEDILNDRDLLS
jgi:phage gp36-like protein